MSSSNHQDSRTHIRRQRILTMSRPPRDDEVWLTQRFSSHATGSSRCLNAIYYPGPTRVLCSKGSRYTRNILDYLEYRKGRVVSIVDRCLGRPDVQVQIPRDSLVFSLLSSVEKDWRIVQPRHCSSAGRGHSCQSAGGKYMRGQSERDQTVMIEARLPAITVPLYVRLSQLTLLRS
jgi:hypothetical protein